MTYGFGLRLMALASLTVATALPASLVWADPVDVDASLIDGLAELSASNRLLILGEVHGSREIPALVLATVERVSRGGEPVTVALEMPDRLNDILTRVLMDEDVAASKAALLADDLWTWRDGRSSQAMLALIMGLRELRQSGRPVRVVAFDVSDSTTQRSAELRESGMAENLRRAYRDNADDRFVVLAGNYHARMAKGAPWNAELEHMAYRLRAERPFTVDVGAPTGSVWVCNPACGVYAFGATSPPAKPIARSFESLSETGYLGEVVIPRQTASPPAVEPPQP